MFHLVQEIRGNDALRESFEDDVVLFDMIHTCSCFVGGNISLPFMPSSRLAGETFSARSSPTHINHRRVNPRIALLHNCRESNYYLDEEIPETRIRSAASSNDALNVHREHSENSSDHVSEGTDGTASLQSDSSEDEFFLMLTVIHPKIKTAQVQHQDVVRISMLQGRRRPKLSKFPLLKHYHSPKHRSKYESTCESGLSIPSIRIDYDSPSNDSAGTSCDESQTVNTVGSNFNNCSTKRRRPIRGSISVDEISNLLSPYRGLRRQSTSACGCSSAPKVPRKLSKTIKTLCASEGFVVPRMSRPSMHLGDEFLKVTRRFSREQVKNTIFQPRGDIVIYRLSNERFFRVDELALNLRHLLNL